MFVILVLLLLSCGALYADDQVPFPLDHTQQERASVLAQPSTTSSVETSETAWVDYIIAQHQLEQQRRQIQQVQQQVRSMNRAMDMNRERIEAISEYRMMSLRRTLLGRVRGADAWRRRFEQLPAARK